MNRTREKDSYRQIAEFYDYVIPYRERQDVTLYLEFSRESGGPVLEIGCGSGRILIPVAKSGIEITGLDLSDKMLSICKSKLANEPEKVPKNATLLKADMRNFNLNKKFARISIPFRAFQHLLTIEDQISCLSCVHRHLKRNGRLMLDLFNPSLQRLVDNRYLKENDEEPEFTMPDGRKVVRKHRLVSRDLEEQILEVEMIYYVTYPDNRRERLIHRTKLRYLFRYEAEHLLARCGLKVEKVYGDLKKTPFGLEANQELVFVAGKS